MPTSDAAANAALDREAQAGGSWWVGLALNSGVTELDEGLTVTVEESALPRVELPRTASAWEDATGRQVQPADQVVFGEAPDDETATFWVLWDSETGGIPQHAGRIPDTEYVAGSTVILPPESLVITYPSLIL